MFGSLGMRVLKKLGFAASIMTLAAFMAYLAFRQPIRVDAGRPRLLINIVKSTIDFSVEKFGSAGSAALYLAVGATLALITLRFKFEERINFDNEKS